MSNEFVTIYSKSNHYMSGSLKYFQYHRFLRDLLIIQKSFGFQKPLQSKSPPVLKIYTYIACQLCKDFYSSQFLKLISESNIQSKSKRRRRNSFSDSLNSNKNLFSTSSHDQNFCFKYFKFKILGRGSGKTLLCEYHEDTIALNWSIQPFWKKCKKELKFIKFSPTFKGNIYKISIMLWLLWRYDVLCYWYNSDLGKLD